MGLLSRIIMTLLKIAGGLVFAMFLFMLFVVTSLHFSRGDKPRMFPSNGAEKRALIIYQPGIGPGIKGVVGGLIQGLQEKGFEVTTNYAHKGLSKDLTAYDLVLIGSPVYAGQTAKTVKNYLTQITQGPSGRLVLFTTGLDEKGAELSSLSRLLRVELDFLQRKFATNDYQQDAYQFALEIVQ